MTKMFLLVPWRADLSSSFLVTHFRQLHQKNLILSMLKIYLLTLEIIASEGYLRASSVFIEDIFFPKNSYCLPSSCSQSYCILVMS